jgi:AcrR family transcriptional regulator
MKGKAKQPRHPVGNGYAQGKETRLRIIEAAIEVFAARGYEEAATRMIADLAAVNLAALNYYFGSKEALYRACAEHIADCASAQFRPIAARVERVLANAAVPQQISWQSFALCSMPSWSP